MVAVPLLRAGWQQLPAEEGVLGDWRLAVVMVVVVVVSEEAVVVAVEVVVVGEEGWPLAEQGHLKGSPWRL